MPDLTVTYVPDLTVDVRDLPEAAGLEVDEQQGHKVEA